MQCTVLEPYAGSLTDLALDASLNICIHFSQHHAPYQDTRLGDGTSPPAIHVLVNFSHPDTTTVRLSRAIPTFCVTSRAHHQLAWQPHSDRHILKTHVTATCPKTGVMAWQPHLAAIESMWVSCEPSNIQHVCARTGTGYTDHQGLLEQRIDKSPSSSGLPSPSA